LFYGVFELPSPKNTPKRDKTKIEEKSVLDFLYFVFMGTNKNYMGFFRHGLFVKIVFMVFLNSPAEKLPKTY
jgi:hypothetical protein